MQNIFIRYKVIKHPVSERDMIPSFPGGETSSWFNPQLCCTCQHFYSQENMDWRQTTSSRRSISPRLWTTSTLTPWGMGRLISATSLLVNKLINYLFEIYPQPCVSSCDILLCLSSHCRQVLEKRLWSYILLHWQWGRHLGICPQLWIHHRVGGWTESLGHIRWTCKFRLIMLYGRSVLAW